MSVFLVVLMGIGACSEPPAGEIAGEADWDAAAWRAELDRHADQVEEAVDGLGWRPDATVDDIPPDHLDRFAAELSALEETVPPVAWRAELSDQARYSHYRNLITDMRYAAHRLSTPREPDAYGDPEYWAERLDRLLERWGEMREEWTDPVTDDGAP
jgi:hypothetical protein